MNTPIITLEVERMQHTVKTALSGYALQLDKDIQAAISRHVTADNVKNIIDKEVKECIDVAVKEEIRRFFSYNDTGRKAIRQAINEWMDRNLRIDND